MADCGLTDKQEAFAVGVVRTANAAEAYRQAYDVPADAKDAWIYVEACQLLDHPKVGPRIDELQAKARERGQFTITQAANEYEDARVLAMGEAQPSAAVSAITAKVKLFGMDKPAKVQQVDKDGNDVADVSNLKLARILQLLTAKASRA